MKPLLLTLFLSLCFVLKAPDNKTLVLIETEPENPFKMLYEATRIVESNCKADTINPNEQAYGETQIRKCKLTDYNNETGSHYTLEDCLKPEIARKIYMHFASKYNPSDIEKCSKRWNGSGPKTEIYWQKISKYLAE
jgi:hypothetical protein